MSTSSPELNSAIKESLACHEAFRRLGFESEEIYVVLDRLPTVIILIKRDDKKFAIELPMMFIKDNRPGTPQEFEADWNNAVHLWNMVFTTNQQREIWMNSRVFSECPHLIAKLLGAGFDIPIPRNDRKTTSN